MLKRFELADKELRLGFELKTKGKFRIKERRKNEIFSTFSSIVSKDNLYQTSFYIEWQISYYVRKESVTTDAILINTDREILLSVEDANKKKTKSVYLSELSELLNQAINLNIIDKKEVSNLREWVCSILPSEILDETVLNHKKSVNNNQILIRRIKDLTFNISYLNLPYCILQNQDKTWIEVIKEKQQYAYSFQPMIYLCIPDEVLSPDNALFWWTISEENWHTIINLFKVFALSSQRHNRDICQIIKEILKNHET